MMRDLKWYCDTSRDHLHESLWEAENCTDLSERLQQALDDLKDLSRNDQQAFSTVMARVRRAEVEDAVNQAYAEAMMDDVDDDVEDDRFDVR